MLSEVFQFSPARLVSLNIFRNSMSLIALTLQALDPHGRENEVLREYLKGHRGKTEGENIYAISPNSVTHFYTQSLNTVNIVGEHISQAAILSKLSSIYYHF